ncbi:S-phase kinase-associated protein 1-like [Microplitis mediator]|uniref:S-phase kinase-associated protein 1-like n=1 Tax=Microplitis mediator TaxID=375433 RepID=UPI0025567B4E|nr:S-phase kinase-associated protein 1-like [Microplitis mediator]
MQTVKVRTSDEKILEIDEKIAMMSNTIKKTIVTRDSEMNGSKSDDDEVIPLPDVTAAELEKLLPWLEHHKDDPPVSPNKVRPADINNISEWDKEYFNKYTLIQLFANINAANNLDIKGYLESSSKLLAQMIVGKTPKDIQQIFNVRPRKDPVAVDDDKSTSNPEVGSPEESK